MLFNMDKGNTRKRRHDVRRASQLLPLARSLYRRPTPVRSLPHLGQPLFPPLIPNGS
jgi:hypothetical protein